MDIKKAEPKDLKYIIDIINILHLYIPGFIWNRAEFVDKQIKQGEYFLAKKDDKTVGVISLKQRGKKMYIETLAVIPEYRMQKIGTQLVSFAKSFTKEKGLSSLIACSFFEYNIGNFYTSQGFSLLHKSGVYNNHHYHIFVINF